MLPTPILKSITELHLRLKVEPVTPILTIGKYAWASPPHPPGPALAGKPPCQAWSTAHFGMWEFKKKLHNIGYGEALHKAYAEWFIRENGKLYDTILIEPHYVLAPFTAKPDIVYCLNGECGLIEVKGFSTDKLAKALPQLSMYAYILRSLGVNLVQAWLVMRNAVLPFNPDYLVRDGEHWFRVVRNWIRKPPKGPAVDCRKCPYALVCRIRK
jgi:CRISPR/Cas system-associated exonuclease Cas4 (RecB family)